MDPQGPEQSLFQYKFIDYTIYINSAFYTLLLS